MTHPKIQLTRTEKKKLRTQELILSVTIDLIESQGFDETTMEQIASVADIAKGTLYNYYSCKEEILSEYIKQTFTKENHSRIKDIENLKSTRERLEYLFDILLKGVKRHKEMFEKYLIFQMKEMVRFEKDKESESGIGTPIAMIIKLGQESGEVRTDMPAETISEFVLFVFIELVKTFYSNPDGFDQNGSIESSINLFLNGASCVAKVV
ncbi:TetR/AcrR family transcriptional regulator [Fusibacter ferrireducens]|uniref:TetR/AcrR family transcriptional regulator n=1 Tax=Fusibacter ferrireducens TaxID=2785058 RepID=A0ABR9ZM42_9FIRM|nr:TetR/AcrR family transcriptional regulator [Fusibacter ferrireducens]MBF4691517.1 TetR/AcrR family transcriptional regulator [Fusibacter ferrireducens]